MMNTPIPKYLVVDGMLHGTGIRDQYDSGYLEPRDLGISEHLITRIELWLKKYEDEHYNNFENQFNVSELDNEGLKISNAIKNELNDVNVSYYSSALSKKYIL